MENEIHFGRGKMESTPNSFWGTMRDLSVILQFSAGDQFRSLLGLISFLSGNQQYHLGKNLGDVTATSTPVVAN